MGDIVANSLIGKVLGVEMHNFRVMKVNTVIGMWFRRLYLPIVHRL